jgi:tetratricopeptide (TPR) repeat protein
LKNRKRQPPSLILICVTLLAPWMALASGGYFISDWAPPTLALAALALFVSVVGFPGIRLRYNTLALGLFVAYTAWTFASLLWSPNKGDAWLGAGQTLLYLLAFWVTVALVTSGASRQWMLIASTIGPAVVAAFTLPSLSPRLEDLFDTVGTYSLIGTVGYHNGEAAFLLVTFWVAVHLGGSRRINPILRAAILAGAVLSVDLAVLTQSRGAMVAMSVSLPVFFLFSGQRLRGLLALAPIATALYVVFPDLNGVYLAFLGKEAPVATLLSLVLPTIWLTAALVGLYGLCWGLVDQRWRPSGNTVRIIGSIVLVGSGVFLVTTVVTLTEHVSDPVALVQQKWEAFKTNDDAGQEQSRYLSASGSGRYALWQVAWEDFAAHPILGIGTQNYEASYYQLREQNSGFVRQPHSLPLEVLGEHGILGGILFFGFLATCLVFGLWGRFRNLPSEQKAQIGALVAAVIYWFVYSSAEWFWQMPAVTLPAIFYLALLASPLQRIEGSAESYGTVSRWPVRTSLGVVAVLAVIVVAPLYIANYYVKQSYTATDPAEGLATLERAQRFNPLDPRLSEREAELAIEAGDWDRVEHAYHRMIELDPGHYAPYMFLATFHERRGEFEKALLYYQKALALNPLSDDLNQHVKQLESSEIDESNLT